MSLVGETFCTGIEKSWSETSWFRVDFDGVATLVSNKIEEISDYSLEAVNVPPPFDKTGFDALNKEEMPEL